MCVCVRVCVCVCVCVSCAGKWFLTQSLDNQILCYSAIDRFKLNTRKSFRGHIVAGFACEISMSPNGESVSLPQGRKDSWLTGGRGAQVRHVG